MSYDARIDESTLTVLVDVRQPFAYLALGPTRALAEKRGLELNWLPCSMSPLNPPPPESEGNERSVAHRRNRARMIGREIETYGEAQGLTLRDYYRDGEWDAVALGLLWMREHARHAFEPFLEAVFAAYWAVELDAADVAAVAKYVEAQGAEAEGFVAWCAGGGPTAAEAVAEELRGRGMTAAPAYYVAGEYFQGRQHLPMVEWLLDGQEGPGPI